VGVSARGVTALTRSIPTRRQQADDLAAEIVELRARSRALDRQRPDRARWVSELDQSRTVITADLDARRREARRSPVAVLELGPRPTEPLAAARWDHAAARLDQHHAAFAHDEPTRLSW
jgi:hypothetical protein